MFLPFVGWLLALAAGVIATREAMELDTGNAIIIVVISGLIAFAIYFALTALL
jgi:hypothetical protein